MSSNNCEEIGELRFLLLAVFVRVSSLRIQRHRLTFPQWQSVGSWFRWVCRSKGHPGEIEKSGSNGVCGVMKKSVRGYFDASTSGTLLLLIFLSFFLHPTKIRHMVTCAQGSNEPQQQLQPPLPPSTSTSTSNPSSTPPKLLQHFHQRHSIRAHQNKLDETMEIDWKAYFCTCNQSFIQWVA